MEKRHIGSLQVTVIGVGCNNFGRRIDAAGTAAVVNAALEAGINFFDTADVYGGTQSEVQLGQALGARRKDVVIATKFGLEVEEGKRGAKPAYLRQAVEESLRRLGTDYIDLYQLHEPDETVPIAETLGALNELVTAGKVREIGCSNFDVPLLREAAAAVRDGAARFVSVQNEYSLIHRPPQELDVLAECARTGMAHLPYFPLASGLLTGKYRLGQSFPTGTRLQAGTGRGAELLTEDNLTRVEALLQFAESRGHTLLELAFSWLLSQPVIASVIAGATNAQQVRDNAAAANWALSMEDFAAVEDMLSRPR